jgi:hypothetical protein
MAWNRWLTFLTAASGPMELAGDLGTAFGVQQRWSGGAMGRRVPEGHNISGGDVIALEIATKDARLLGQMGPLRPFTEIGFHVFGLVLVNMNR